LPPTRDRSEAQPCFFPAATFNAFAANSKGTEFVLGEAPFAAGQTLTVLTNWEARLK